MQKDLAHLTRTATWLPLTVLTAWFEPALANKFETIGGGISGSAGLKLEWLQTFLFIIAGMGALGALLAVVYPRKNALFLNYTNWKKSAIVMGTISGVALFFGLLL